MSQMRKWNFKQKNKARGIALTTLKTFVKTALFFPSDKCFDLIIALENGLINAKTRLVIVEHNIDNIRTIKKFLAKNGLDNFHIHNDAVEKLDLNLALNGKKLDFMFLDICGNLTSKIADWLYANQDNFAPDMNMPSTFQLAPRGKREKTRGRQSRKPLTLFYGTVKRIVQDMEYTNLYPTKSNLLECEYIHTENLLRDIRLTSKTLFHVFSKRNISIKEVFAYRDTSGKSLNMMMLNITIGDCKKEDKTWETIVERYDSKATDTIRKYGRTKTYKKRKKNKIARVVLVEMSGIAKYKTYDKIPQKILNKITEQANLNKASVVMTHAGYKAYLKRLAA